MDRTVNKKGYTAKYPLPILAMLFVERLTIYGISYSSLSMNGNVWKRIIVMITSSSDCSINLQSVQQPDSLFKTIHDC